MPIPNYSTAILRLILLSALFALCPWMFMKDVKAQGYSAPVNKLSVDLRQRMRALQNGDRVDVLIQSNSAWSQAIDNAIMNSAGSVKRSYQNFNVRAVSLPVTAVQVMANLSGVGHISLDREVESLGHISLTTGADAARVMGGTSTLNGTGIGIAVLDSGIDPRHVAFNGLNVKSRIVVNVDFTGENRTDDPYGHGTHVASIAAGNGNVAQGAYIGIASNATILNLRVLDSHGHGTMSGLLSALDWIMTNRSTYNIRVVNMSLGALAIDSYKNDPLCQSVRRLVNAGVVVVAAAGNDGKDSSGTKVYGHIHSPGNDPSVITIGASNTFGTDTRGDDAVTTYSSRGPTRSYWTDALGTKHYDNLIKPDLVAPGNKVIAAEAAGNYLVTNNPSLDANVSSSSIREQMYLSGTSMATPVVAGAAALMLQANPTLTPNLVKAILMYTAQPLNGYNQLEQGAGEINIEGAVRLARLIRTDLSSLTLVGSPLLCSTCGVPTQQTIIAGYSFPWGGGLIMDNTFATGLNLITKYQTVYGLGVILGDGTVVNANGVLISDGTMMSDGVAMSDHILTSADTNLSTNGIKLNEGNQFLSCGALLGDGVILGDSVNGTYISDGVLIGDGLLMSDGVLINDGVILGDVNVQANKVMIDGDTFGSSMSVVKANPPIAPVNLATAVKPGSEIDLTWIDNSNNEDGFYVELSTDGFNFTQIATLGAGIKSYASTGLSAAKKYYYRVCAYNGDGNSAFSNTAYATIRSK